MLKEEALTRLMKYCAYRERSHAEVRSKLLDLKVYGDDLEEVISKLITEGFLNEERYARAYVRGKFKNNKWGRNKILNGLKFNKLSNYSIKKGLEEIDESAYLQTLRIIIEKKLIQLNESDKFILYKKLTQYAIQKGYEYELVKDSINNIFADLGIK